MGETATCPKCGSQPPGKALRAWKYATYDVKRYECGRCKSKFNVYRSPKRTFTIPKGK